MRAEPNHSHGSAWTLWAAVALVATTGIGCSTQTSSEDSSTAEAEATEQKTPATTSESEDTCQRYITDDPWVWETPAPRGEDLHTVSGSGDDDVWALGGVDRSVVVHWDGERWRHHNPPDTSYRPRDIWVASSDAAWVSANDGLYRWADCSWNHLHETDDDTGKLGQIVAFGSDDIWIAGPGASVTHWDGDEVRTTDLPEEPFDDFSARMIGGNSADDLVVYGHTDGFRRTAEGDWEPLTWEMQASVVRGDGSGGVWVFPETTKNNDARHFDGESWTDVALPTEPPGDSPGFSPKGMRLGTGWATSDQVWIAADSILQQAANDPDGGEWAPVAEPFSHRIDDLWRSPSGTWYGVGKRGVMVRGKPEGDWRQTSRPAPGTINDFAAVDGEVRWAIIRGTRSAGARLMGYEDGQWTAVETPETNRLHAVAATDDGEAWAGGPRGLLHWNGSAWKPTEVPATGEWGRREGSSVEDLLTLPDGELWVVSNGVWRRKGGDWEQLLTAEKLGDDYEAIDGSPSGGVFVSLCDEVLQWDGSEWTRHSLEDGIVVAPRTSTSLTPRDRSGRSDGSICANSTMGNGPKPSRSIARVKEGSPRSEGVTGRSGSPTARRTFSTGTETSGPTSRARRSISIEDSPPCRSETTPSGSRSTNTESSDASGKDFRRPDLWGWTSVDECETYHSP